MTIPASVHSCCNIVSRICPASPISNRLEKTHRHEPFSSPSNSTIHYQSCKPTLIDAMICRVTVFQRLCMRTLGILDQSWLKAEKCYCRSPAYFLFVLLKPAKSRGTKSKLVLTGSSRAWMLEVTQSFLERYVHRLIARSSFRLYFIHRNVQAWGMCPGLMQAPTNLTN